MVALQLKKKKEKSFLSKYILELVQPLPLTDMSELPELPN